jgi:outer membrane protein assembly factor BamB
VAGGELGNNEQGSSYWTTSQYNPKFAPVIMNGILYSTWYTTTTSSQQGVMAVNLYTGETLWVINSTYPLRCGMIVNFENINQYGTVGPYIFTASNTGLFSFGISNWYMYDGLTGQYLAEIDSAPTFAFLGQDDNGNIIGYAFNNTAGSMVVNGKTFTITNTTLNGPALEMFNLTVAMGQTGLNWGITQGTVYQWKNGLQWAVQSLPPVVNGISTVGLGTGAFGISEWSGNTLVMTTGAVSVAETMGWLVEAGFNSQTGQLMWIENRTGGIYVPYTRLTNTPSAAAGVYVIINQATYDMEAYSLTTGKQVWTSTLNVPMYNGKMPNSYDEFDFETVPDSTTGVLYIWGLGGDVWAVNMTNGKIIWSWSTEQSNGPAGSETPYGIFPLWVFQDEALANKDSPILYLAEGHEYSPPLFHGAQLLALNGTTGELIWDCLGFDNTAAAVAYGVLTTFNSYDGQIYAYAQGPSKTTVSAPNIGVTTSTPVTITGTVTDICAGSQQEAVAANFPNGLPAVSDESMSHFMEAVYEQQPMPTNVTGVPVTIAVTDSNNNCYDIGTATTNPNGFYSLTWTPTIPGNFMVTATFAGTQSYYGSTASTAFYASLSPETSSVPTATPAASAADMYFVPAIAGIFVLIIIVLVLLVVLMLRKR